MENLKYIPFMIFYSSIAIFFDVYFLLSLKQFIRTYKLSIDYYTAIKYLTVFMFVVAIYSIHIQVFDITPGYVERYIMIAQSIWYIPKFIIVPVLAIYNLTRKIKKYRNKFKPKLLLSIRQKVKPIIEEPRIALQTNTNFQINQNLSTDILSKSIKIANKSQNNKLIERRKFIKNSSLAFFGVPFFTIAKDAVDSTYDILINRVTIPIKDLPQEFEGFTIAHISDVHAGSFVDSTFIDSAAEMLNKFKPDIIAATGDFVNFKQDEFDLLHNAFSAMQAKYGKFGCLGNHDHFMDKRDTHRLINKIEKTDMHLLINENIEIKKENKSIFIAGSDNYGYGQTFGDFDKTLDGADPHSPIVLLCHDPTNWEREIRQRRPVDLMLSGHTHGGQAGISFIGKTITPATFVYKHYKGLYSDFYQHLYINCGLGTSGIPIRLGIPPEITLIILTKSQV
jgi:hypothetical protein